MLGQPPGAGPFSRFSPSLARRRALGQPALLPRCAKCVSLSLDLCPRGACIYVVKRMREGKSGYLTLL